MPQIADPYSEYNPLLDKYLNHYFEHKTVIDQLKRSQILGKNGKILDSKLQKSLDRLAGSTPLSKNFRQKSLPIQVLVERISKKKFLPPR